MHSAQCQHMSRPGQSETLSHHRRKHIVVSGEHRIEHIGGVGRKSALVEYEMRQLRPPAVKRVAPAGGRRYNLQIPGPHMRGGAYGIAQIISAREKFIGCEIMFGKRADRRAELNPVACFYQGKHG